MSNSPSAGAEAEEVLTPRLGRVASLTLAIIVGCEMMLMLDGTIMNVALPVIRDGLDFSTAGLSWVTNSFLLAFGGLLLLGGRAGDILGKRRVFVAGIVIFTVASLLGGIATGQEWLIAMRALQGVGAALAGPSTLALLITSFQGPAQTKALGVYSSVTASAMTLGLILGGVITTLVSWRWVLFINIPIGLFVVLLAPRYVAETPKNSGRFDVVGAVTSAVGMTGVVFGLVRTADHGWSDPTALISLAVGAVLLVAFVLVERGAAQPIMPLGLFADRSRTGAYLGLLLVPMVTLSMQFLLVQFVQEVEGFNPLQAGLAFLPMAAGLLFSAQYAAKPLGRYGAKATSVAGLVLLLASTLWLTQLAATTGYWVGVFGPLLLAGAGLGFVVVPFNVLIMSTVDPKESGAASGVLQALMMTGASLGVAILSTVYATVAGGNTEGGSAAIADGMRAGFWVSTGFAALALLVALVVIKSSAKQAAPTDTPAETVTAD